MYVCRVGDVERHGLGERVSGRPCEKAKEKNLLISTCARQHSGKKRWEKRQLGKNELSECNPTLLQSTSRM